MKIAVISDIHDNLVNLDKALRIIKREKVETIICCGDVTTVETLERLRQGFSGEIFLVTGNMEIYDESEARQIEGINFLGKFGVVQLADHNFGACHEPFYIERLLASRPDVDFDIIFYGHTHKPWLEEKVVRGRSVRLANPGTLGGVFQKASFAVYDLDSRELGLKVLENIEG